MNERVRQLAEQAGLKVNADGEIGPAFFGSVDAGYRKFAQLIVRECANICEDIADPTLYRNADYHSRMSPGASYAAKVIKFRFGVEE